MKRLFFVASLALAGCATNAKFQQNMNSWLHEPEGRLISALGPPSSVYEVNSDERILTFSQSDQLVMPGQMYSTPSTTSTTGYYGNQSFRAQSTTYTQQQMPATVINLSCTINFTVRYGIVINWQASGNHCVAR